MFLNASFTLLLLGILMPVLVTGQECGLRNTAAAGRSCERACGDGGTCRKENRECVCDGLCGLSCLKKACPLLQSPVEGNVTVTPSQHYIGAIAEYRCNRDFTLVGNSNRTCQSDKTWSGSEPVCRELSDSAPVLAETHHCSFLAFPTNGVVAYYEERRIEGAIATYRCDDGYTLTGNKNRTCLREGSWSGTEPDCVVVSCPDVNIQDGHVHREEVNRVSREGDEITFSCNEGFQLRYPQRRRCAEDGHWIQTIPLCEAVNCGDLENPNNGLKIGDDVSYGSEVSFRCRVGYILEGMESVICQTDGSWSGPLPTCNEDNPCSRPDIFPNIIAHVGVGEYTTAIGNRQSFMGGETITFRCEDVRYQILDGPIHRQCIDGEWTERAPRCETSQLQVGVDNTILKTVSPDGTFIVYLIVGSVFINCQLRAGARIWNSATITTNSTTQPPQRAYIVAGKKRLRLRNPTSGNDGTYTCQAGSQRHSIRIKFQDIRCPAPGNVSNGSWVYVRPTGNTLNPHAYILNEKVTLQCYRGYHASSNQESRCNYQGQWSPPLSSCIAD